ncbi:MAG: 3-hydroxyacyl-CoA dehydrogenase [Actinobacteria bacterium]|nr:3-hydroxyacyl-CoA dehydrogenase [Actinomycetota bacterium]
MKIAIVGSGSIGAAWAITFARAGHEVCVHDVDPTKLDSLNTNLIKRLDFLSAEGMLTEEPTKIVGRISTTTDLGECVANAEYVQECAPEKVELKEAIFEDLDRLTSSAVILASSSSALGASKFNAKMKHPERAIVVHPGNPPYLLSIAEVVPSDVTSPEVVIATMELLTQVGMHPVQVKKEIEGFVFNRLQGAILREAYALVRDGVISPREIDIIMTQGLGKRWAVLGPFGTSSLNAQGGIRDHASRIGESYFRMGKERNQNDPWTPDLVEKVAEDMGEIFQVADWEANVEKRDRALAEINKLIATSKNFNFYENS